MFICDGQKPIRKPHCPSANKGINYGTAIEANTTKQ